MSTNTCRALTHERAVAAGVTRRHTVAVPLRVRRNGAGKLELINAAREPIPIRMFVGRVELLSPWMEQKIEHALDAQDVHAPEKYGRFLQPFASPVTRTRPDLMQAPRVPGFFRSARSRLQAERNYPVCGK